MKKQDWARLVMAASLYAVLPLHAGHDDGLQDNKRSNETAELIHAFAATGVASWQNNLGLMYAKGALGVPQDHSKAVYWYRKAADQGYDDAENNLGDMYYDGLGLPQDFKKAAAWYRRAAEQGHAEAQYKLGVLYGDGQGVQQDFKIAVTWYRKAAEQGHASAQSNLGNMYHFGMGVAQDYKEAVTWYRKAAEQGLAYAQNNLGVMYKNGLGVPQSYVAAYALFNLSAANDPSGSSNASANRAKLANSMTAKDIEAAQALTRALAQQGSFAQALERFERLAGGTKSAASDRDRSAKPAASDPWPARPAKVSGQVRCNTRCVNADCWRTYDDGRKVKFRAKQKWDAFDNRFVWDSGSC